MSLRKLVPSSGALFMFEAAARHQNFTAASREFNVTQSAVSRMIGRLEKHLDVKLFDRKATGLELTEDGALLFRAVGNGFLEIEAALEEISTRSGRDGVVTISLSSAFAIYWLMPRFSLFRESYPEIDLRFQLIHGEPIGPFEGVDLGIHRNPLDSDQYHSWKLADEIIVPVCNAGYLAAHGGLDDREDLRGHTLAHLSGAIRVPWQRFLADCGYPDSQGCRNLVFSDYALLIQAAIKGQAIALGWWHVVANELQQHGLMRAGRRDMRTGDSYYLVASAARPLRRPAALVRDWLIAQFEDAAQAAAD